MNRIKMYLPPALWMLIIFCLSSIPSRSLPHMPFTGFDKIVHICLYAVLGFLLAGALGRRSTLIFFIGAVYGVSDELHQILIPGREFSVLDIFADCAGIIIGILWRSFYTRYL